MYPASDVDTGHAGGSVRYSEVINGDVESSNGETAIIESEVTNDNTGMENQYAEITIPIPILTTIFLLTKRNLKPQMRQMIVLWASA